MGNLPADQAVRRIASRNLPASVLNPKDRVIELTGLEMTNGHF
jgi:hypothetical protein